MGDNHSQYTEVFYKSGSALLSLLLVFFLYLKEPAWVWVLQVEAVSGILDRAQSHTAENPSPWFTSTLITKCYILPSSRPLPPLRLPASHLLFLEYLWLVPLFSSLGV